jgi:hypothetical protein
MMLVAFCVVCHLIILRRRHAILPVVLRLLDYNSCLKIRCKLTQFSFPFDSTIIFCPHIQFNEIGVVTDIEVQLFRTYFQHLHNLTFLQVV